MHSTRMQFHPPPFHQEVEEAEVGGWVGKEKIQGGQVGNPWG